MRIAIVGAGAVGGLFGARLAERGHAVSAVARGATLAALRAHGWRAETVDGPRHGPVAAADADAAALGVQDLVVVAVKAPALGTAARALAPLLGPETVVLPAMNGVPWWFCQGLAGPAAGLALRSVDPDGTIAAHVPLGRVVGAVVHAASRVAAPGEVVNAMGRGLVVGEPLGGVSARVEGLRALLDDAGFETTASACLQRDVWFKLWGNMTINPLAALAGVTADRLLADELVRGFMSTAMREAAQVGERLGLPIADDPEARHAVTAKLGAFRPSMLQDVDAGRAIELDALVGAVRELAAHVGVATPAIDALFGLARVFARGRGLYPA